MRNSPFNKYQPWPWFEVEVSATSNPDESETIKVQAENEGMAGFLAMRMSSICKQFGCGQVDNVKLLKEKVAS
jgi:hypothetical protein